MNINQALAKSPNLAVLCIDESGKISFINKKFESIFVLASKSFLGQNLENLVKNVAQLSFLVEIFNQKLSSKNLFENIIVKDGSYFRINVANVLKNGTLFDGLIVTASDISYEKALENEKIKQTHMLSLNSKMASLGEMMSAISHQHQSPINAVFLSLDEISECVKNGDLAAINSHILRVKQGLKLMNETTNAFVKFYKNDEKISKVSLDLLINELVFIVRQKLNERGISLEIIYDKSQKYAIKSNGAQIKQILLSLISNAKDALNYKNQAPKITICLEKSGNEFIISVADNGTGIRQKNMIFEPFFTTKNKSGTGMGLYVARLLAQNLGGDLRLKSPKNPTKFSLHLQDKAKCMQR
ncbi:PAS domain-containing sensor histidine kinase [Campylobacter gastrosuis]|uniref:histidine kinase n=1 Tax=Campylobacter gastrosuis TaxID=2974576 RepID=A0ABT7HQ79_9BACT|nr:ATP-binding protein [Campylobacter gastrosuis]MDL0089077.1 PAS domain-containing sensor histidine kinase [Campylobacter gastrosuis]